MKQLTWLAAVAALAIIAWLGSGTGAAKDDAPAAERGVFATIAPFNSYGHVHDGDNVEAMRPRVMGTHGVISSGHYLATQAGYDVLKAGGNAFDAGVTAGMALKALKMDYAGWTGVAPLIVYSAAEDRVITRVGAGTSPALATLDHFLEHGKSPVNNALIPADVDVWLAALDRFGTLSFGEAARPTLRIAEEGYHLYKMQKWMIEDQMEEILAFPYNGDFWFQNGVGEQRLGDLMVNADLGRLIRYMMAAEEQALAAGGSRSEGIRAARDAFYKGDPARDVDRFFREHGGIVRYEDLVGYESRWEEPLGTSFRGYDVYTGDGWSQGPRIVLMLNMLENYDLGALGYNTPEYIHLVSQVINLAMSDSHRYVGDPDFAPAPEGLYGKEYARERIGLIDEKKRVSGHAAVGGSDGDGGGGGRRAGGLRGGERRRRRTGPFHRHLVAERHGRRGQPVLADRERWPHPHADDPGMGVRAGQPHGPVQPGPGAGQRDGSRQAPAQHQRAPSGDEGRAAVHGTLHPRRRPAVAVPPAGPPERRGVGDVARAGAGPTPLRQLQLPGLGQRGEPQSRDAPPRGPDSGGDGGSAPGDGARRAVLGPVELARVRPPPSPGATRRPA